MEMLIPDMRVIIASTELSYASMRAEIDEFFSDITVIALTAAIA